MKKWGYIFQSSEKKECINKESGNGEKKKKVKGRTIENDIPDIVFQQDLLR